MFSVEVNAEIEDNVGEKVESGVNKYLMKGADRGFAEMTDKAPVDRSNLLQNMFSPQKDRGSIVYGVRNVPYARAMEYGTEPGHTPPIEPLAEWAERIGKSRGFGIWVATEKIPDEGVDPQPYMRPARDAQVQWYSSHSVKDYINDELD